jgi:hypothetical protein
VGGPAGGAVGGPAGVSGPSRTSDSSINPTSGTPGSVTSSGSPFNSTSASCLARSNSASKVPTFTTLVLREISELIFSSRSEYRSISF